MEVEGPNLQFSNHARDTLLNRYKTSNRPVKLNLFETGFSYQTPISIGGLISRSREGSRLRFFRRHLMLVQAGVMAAPGQ